MLVRMPRVHNGLASGELECIYVTKYVTNNINKECTPRQSSRKGMIYVSTKLVHK